MAKSNFFKPKQLYIAVACVAGLLGAGVLSTPSYAQSKSKIDAEASTGRVTIRFGAEVSTPKGLPDGGSTGYQGSGYVHGEISAPGASVSAQASNGGGGGGGNTTLERLARDGGTSTKTKAN